MVAGLNTENKTHFYFMKKKNLRLLTKLFLIFQKLYYTTFLTFKSLTHSLTFDTTVVSVSLEAGWTELAHSFVILHFAGCVVRTYLSLARILTLIVYTSLMGGAAPVLQTNGYRWVATLHTNTCGQVVEHLALFVSRADARIVARIHTTAVGTSKMS